jgi:DNA-binding NarL/FixJ family response regulator
MSGKRIRLLLVDDHEIVRVGLRAMLQPHVDIEVVGEGDRAADVVPLFRSTGANVVLLDLQLRGDASGVDAIRELRRFDATSRVVVLTNYSDEEHVFGAIAAGAQGYVLKYAEPAQIVDAVRSAHAGYRYIAPEASSRLAEHAHNSPLTDREHDVLKLLARGDKNKRIAAILGVAEETVKTHVRNILSKLGASCRTEAANKAVQRGMVRAGDPSNE